VPDKLSLTVLVFQDEELHQELPVPSQEDRRLLSCALPFHLCPVQLHVLELLHDQATGEIDPSPSPLPLPPPSSPIHLEKKPKRIALSILNPLGVFSKNSIMSVILLEKVDIKKQSSAAATKSSFSAGKCRPIDRQREYQRLTDWSSATREDGLISVLTQERSSI